MAANNRGPKFDEFCSKGNAVGANFCTLNRKMSQILLGKMSFIEISGIFWGFLVILGKKLGQKFSIVKNWAIFYWLKL
jgi:hypothetical protein